MVVEVQATLFLFLFLLIFRGFYFNFLHFFQIICGRGDVCYHKTLAHLNYAMHSYSPYDSFSMTHSVDIGTPQLYNAY